MDQSIDSNSDGPLHKLHPDPSKVLCALVTPLEPFSISIWPLSSQESFKAPLEHS